MGDVNDFSGFRRQYQRELERLEEADIDDRDREAIRTFIDRKVGDLAVSSLAEYATRMRAAAERSPVPLVDMDEDDFFQLRTRLLTDPECNPNGDEPLAEITVHNYAVQVRRLLRFLDREWADDLELPRPDAPDIDPGDMLIQEDVAALREAATRTRDIALVEFLADTGARLSLVGSLRVQDVNVDDEQAYYRPNPNAIGLKGATITRYPIIDARGALRAYLNHTHPRPDEDGVALFHRATDAARPVDDDDDGSISPTQVRRILRGLAEAAGIEKPVNPHNFRHSAITRMDREGYDRSEIEHRVQWDIDSDMWDRYLHLRTEQLNEDIFQKAGVAVDEESGPSTRREQCPNCRETLPAEGEYCNYCATPITAEARERQEAIEEDGLDALTEADLSQTERRIVRAALDIAREDPERPPPESTPSHD